MAAQIIGIPPAAIADRAQHVLIGRRVGAAKLRWGPNCPGDINTDGIVNVIDLLAVINKWGMCPAPPAACSADVAPDPDGDGQVNVLDLLLVINNWG